VSAGETFRALAAAEWAWRLEEFPRLATQAGVHDHDHRLERMDPASCEARRQHWRELQSALAALAEDQLGPRDRVDRAVLHHQVQVQLDELELGGALMPIDGDSAFYSYLGELWRDQPLHTTEQIARYVERLAAIPRFFDDHIELLDLALARGVLPPAVVLQGRDAPLVPLAEATDPRETPFLAPLRGNKAFSPALAERAERVVGQQVLPAYRKLLAYLRQAYLPRGRQGLAATELPDGEAFYAARLRGFTTLPASAREIHDTGAAEVERIGAEMRRLQHECGGNGALADFVAALRSDPRHRLRSTEELLGRASWIAKRVDARLPRYFGRLPRQPFGIEPVPEAIAPFYTAGRYVPAALDGDRAALYWVNTHALESRALYTLPALTLHEAVPGHHLQFALSAEDPKLPPYRRHDFTLSAHTEGWALYAEFLGQEMGLYETPLERFGRASYEMWRACRLVVDTGVHAFGWSRERAQAYLRGHTSLSEHELVNEVDRYIGWPGQAVSYKMGELRIRALRSRLEAAAGSAFDLRAFHDRLLALGPVPLPALERELASDQALCVEA
jgi:uncharacterized protein (DUF885 family)